MLVNLAMSSLCGGFQTFLGFILDEWPQLQKYRIHLTVGLSTIYFLMGKFIIKVKIIPSILTILNDIEQVTST